MLRTMLSIAAGWKHRYTLILSVLLVFNAVAAPDFTGMTDLEVLQHKDKSAAIAEFKRRARDYSPAKIREIEQEYHQTLMTPSASGIRTPDKIFREINSNQDTLEQLALFDTLHKLYEAEDHAGRSDIRSAFLRAWGEIEYPTEYDTSQIHAMLRYRSYAQQAGLYFNSEAELLPILVERCLNSAAYDRYSLFTTSLLQAKVPLGEVAAEWAETVYGETVGNSESYFLDCNLSTLRSQLLRVLGRCGKPGLDALLRLGREDSESGYWSLGINTCPESEILLWELYERKHADQDETRLKILRAIASKGGGAEDRAARQQRIRTELVSYLKLPQGKVSLWNVQSAVELAKDTEDPYYLPHINTLETEFFALDPAEYHVPGMEDRMGEALANLRERFEEAKSRLSQSADASGEATF